MNRSIETGLGVLSSPNRRVRFLRYGIAALLLQACWLSAAYADLGSTSKPTVSGVPAGSLGTPPPANKEEEAPGVPVLEGGPAKRVDVKPARRGTVPAEGTERPSAAPAPLGSQTPAGTVPPIQAQPKPITLPDPAITLMVKSGSAEFVNWQDAITINEPTWLSMRWSAKGSQPSGIAWAIYDRLITGIEHPASVAGLAQGSVKASDKTFSVDFRGLIPAFPPAAPNKYVYWVFAWPVDASGKAIGGNRDHVRIEYKDKVTSTFIPPCSRNQDCNSGMVCSKKDKTCVVPSYFCEGHEVLVSVDGTRRDCGAYACNPMGPTGSNDGMAHCRSSCSSTAYCSRHYVCSEHGECIPATDCRFSAECPQGFLCASPGIGGAANQCIKK